MNRRTVSDSREAWPRSASGSAHARLFRTRAERHAAAPAGVLPPVNASWDRVIRTTVGLRPHRDAGFVLKADKLDDKTLIHNYGHGGSGMSLSWGTGAMAADLALAAHRAPRGGDRLAAWSGSRPRAQLQRRGFDVTIYAATVPPDMTSNMSLAGFTPTSGLVDNRHRTPEWDAQFRQRCASRIGSCSCWPDRATALAGSTTTRRPTTNSAAAGRRHA